MVNVAINGFGRIGRLVFRAGHDNKKINFVAINDLTEPKVLAQLLKRDSIHGDFKGEIKHTKDSLVIDGKKIRIFAEKDPEQLPWKALKVDAVIESTGFFTKRDGAEKHLKAGAKKVLISAPSKDADFMLVLGVNHKGYNAKKHDIVSNASCTTNCLAPVVKVVNDHLKVKRGLMTTIHSYTADQNLMDGIHRKGDLRRARCAALNMVPTTTGAAVAVTKVIPELDGKLDGMAIRVPTADGSITDFTFEVKKNTTAEKVNELFKKASKKEFKGIIEYTEEPIVSTDIIGNPYSAVFDAALTKVIDGNFVKVIAWYDNEWGYSKRMIDVLLFLVK